jgi:hypothetical protein
LPSDSEPPSQSHTSPAPKATSSPASMSSLVKGWGQAAAALPSAGAPGLSIAISASQVDHSASTPAAWASSWSPAAESSQGMAQSGLAQNTDGLALRGSCVHP